MAKFIKLGKSTHINVDHIITFYQDEIDTRTTVVLSQNKSMSGSREYQFSETVDEIMAMINETE